MLETGILLWISFLAVAFAVAANVVRSLTFGWRAADIGASDLDLYRSQLDALEAEKANGSISSVEAEAASIEIGRRLLRAEKDDANRLLNRDSKKRQRVAAIFALLIVPGVALAVYGAGGTPNMPGFPLASRLPSGPNSDVATLLSRVEAHLQSNPDDAKGWELVAPVYIRSGRFDDAAAAVRNVIRILGSTAEREADLGEVLVAARQGVVTSEALDAFRRAVQIDKNHVKTRFYLAIAAEQDGNVGEARQMLAALLAEAPEDAPWKTLVQQELARISGRGSAPDSGAAAEISKLGTAEQQAAIAGMVAQLAARLKDKPDDFEGWLRLLRAYRVMGETAGFDAALGRVRQTFAGDSGKMGQLDQFLAALPERKTP